MLVLQVLDKTPFPVHLEATVHAAVIVVFMLHLLMLLQVSLLSCRVGAEIAVVSNSLMHPSCMAKKTSFVWSPVVAKVAGKANTLVNCKDMPPHVAHSGCAVCAKVT